jgi:hypothetical protein
MRPAVLAPVSSTRRPPQALFNATPTRNSANREVLALEAASSELLPFLFRIVVCLINAL